MNQFHKDILENQKILYSYALSLTKNEDDAKDLVQDIFVRAITKQHLFKEGTNLKAWLCTLMKNYFLTSLIKKKRFVSKKEVDFEELMKFISEKEVSYNLGESNIGVDLINQLIDNLTDRQRNSFLLRLKGYQYNQIANLLDIPLGSVKSNLFETKEILKHKLKKLGYENSKT